MSLPTVSMALLQGHLLRYKNDPDGAVRDVSTSLTAAEKPRKVVHTGGSNRGATGAAKSGGKVVMNNSVNKRVKTAAEIDKMVFNPQPGWDSNL